MKKNINVKFLVLVLIVLTNMSVLFTEERFGIFLNKLYQNPHEPITFVLDKNNLKLTHYFHEYIDSIVESSELYNVGYFDYLETPSEKYMIFSATVNDVYFLNLLSHYQSTTQPFAQTLNQEFYYSDSRKFPGSNWLQPARVINASSYVSEMLNNTEVHYLPEWWSLYYMPWAISNTIKQKKITLNWDLQSLMGTAYFKIDTLVISTGFVMPSKPHLYEENCRAKTIRITVNGKTIERVLIDTPNYQLVPLPQFFYANSSVNVELEIIDWYEGTKYNDIVISSVSVPILQ